MIPVDEILKNSREIMHSDIGMLSYILRDTVDQYIAIRVGDHGDLLDGEFAELMAIYQSMQWLLSDIRETRKFKVV